MEKFAFDFLITMIHSVWQTAILLLLYFMVTPGLKPDSPLVKRNLLFWLMLVQLMLSVTTFFLLQTAFTGIAAHAGLLSIFAPLGWLKRYATLLLAFYMGFILMRSLRNFIYWIKFTRQLPISLSNIPVALRLYTSTHSSIIGIHRKVQIWYSTAVNSPITYGCWKPVILLPLAMVNRLTIEQTEAIILHELAHIRQHDYLLNWFLLFSETVFFFNPFVQIIAGKIKLEREKHCDTIVLRFRPDAVRYAETLLQISRMRSISLPMQMAAVKPGQALLKRVLFFTNPRNLEFKNNRTFLSPLVILTGVILNLGIVFSLIPKQQASLLQKITVASQLNTVIKSPEIPALIRQQSAIAVISGQGTEIKKPARKMNSLRQIVKTEVGPENFAEPETEIDMPFFQVSSPEKEISGKEFVLTNRADNGAVLTAKYRAIFVDGMWILEPLWLKTDIPWNSKDSVAHASDSLILLYPVVQ